MKPAPRSPPELKDALARIFPLLPRDFGAHGESVLEDAGPTYHSVLRDFAHFFARDIDQFSDRQLRRLAELVARSMAAPGALEHAMDTCFLEHARQLAVVDRRFAPFLAAAKKSADEE
jgi:hypothetical protein